MKFLILGRIERAPLAITIDGITVFGGDRPRALVAKIVPTPALIELQAEHERLIRRLGLPAETRKFTPHVTLARLRDTSPFELANFLGMISHPPRSNFEVDSFEVFLRVRRWAAAHMLLKRHIHFAICRLIFCNAERRKEIS